MRNEQEATKPNSAQPARKLLFLASPGDSTAGWASIFVTGETK